MKQKACKVCRQKFLPTRPLQSVCGVVCALERARSMAAKQALAKARQARKELRERKEKLKTRMDYQREAQAAMNAFRRYEDMLAGHGCISCGNQNPVQWHAGHFLSRGAHPELALEPRNIFLQCSQCNDYLSGNQLEMRKGILARKGQAELDWLEGPHDPKKYTIPELKAIKTHYKQKLAELKKGQS